MSRLVNRDNVLRVSVLGWLTAVWVALWGDLSAANVLAGFAVALIVVFALPLPKVPVAGRFHPLSFLQLIATSAYYALESSLQVAWFAIRPAGPPVSGVLRVHLSIQSDLVLVMATDIFNLIPGTMVLEVDRARCVIYVHVLDVGSEKSVVKFYSTTRRLEHLLINAFERPRERRRLGREPEALS
ncbi:Na+/H+ antiporter subunit E [Nocardia neocaledoniensis NBRC 108232]|uniref:Multisubunit sodium/proton antiporter MrpE subunit n=1 Tax=Nocardia neocaledoniensis TaxID=236511 RepID=A0A317NF59_9NOCA|nr:Na+/H+ antiporter subunit E [Nocardia neocaledoniensis]PWV73464.1 multisubunit sodium/proton antiporter MrpE subunit [Nocardia neocaledoniensis]GEM30022.1 Na+/H+ antiporter subunit E [Nocardia neocaledoniensis NBRC 108232]